MIAIHFLGASELGIKHRDVSINNLMFRRLKDGSVQGVLNDWDVASTRETESRPDHVGMRTGTRPFMSMDLHVDNPPVHMVRFDYESLLYVLYWICVGYSDGGLLPEEKRHPNAKKWSKWVSADDDDVWNAKVAFVHLMVLDETKFPEQFRSVVTSWIKPLRRLFSEGYSARRVFLSGRTKKQINHEPPTPTVQSILAILGHQERTEQIPEVEDTVTCTEFDDATLGGHVTFAKIGRILMT